MKPLLIQLGVWLVRTAISVALDHRVRSLAYQAVAQAEKMDMSGPDKLKRAAEIMRDSQAAKELPSMLRTLAVERAVEELHKRLK